MNEITHPSDDPVDAIDHETVDNIVDSVDLPSLDDNTLEALDDEVADLLNGDPFDFPSDEALQAAFQLSRDIRDEFHDRDPATDDPYHLPDDTAERFDLPIVAVEIENTGRYDGPSAYIRLTLDVSDLDTDDETDDTWAFRPETDIAGIAADHYGVEDPRALGIAVGDTLPVVGSSVYAWNRVDRYALENDGETAIDE